MKKTIEASNDYDDDDNKFIHAINKIGDTIGKKRLEGGKLVDEYVTRKNGTVYGQQTILVISQHPDIQVCERTLRRWWAYYKIYKASGDEIQKRCPQINARNYYELARILDAEILTRDGESQEGARCRVILELVDWLAKKRVNSGISCNDFARMVTETIDTGCTPAADKEESAIGEKKPTKKRSALGELIAFNNVTEASKYLETFSDPQHLATASINNTELSLDLKRMGDSLMRMADHLASSGYVDPVRAFIDALRTGFANIEAKLEPTIDN